MAASLSDNNATVTLTPVAGRYGTNSIQVVATDNSGFEATNTFMVEIRPAPARLAQPAFVSDQLQIKVFGSAGGTYALEASWDLENWIEVQTTTMPQSELFLFSSPIDVNSSRTFYRVVAP